MPFFRHQRNVDRDWQYEQVRSEIKRLTELLHNPDLTAQERTIAQSQLDNYLAGPTARRSTRILALVRLKIVGESRVGTPQLELTSAVAVNCHGCLCLSRHEYPRNSSMTLEVSSLQTGRKASPVRANVRFIRLPGNPRELYSVGIELETPANIWGVEPVPEDWLPYLDRASVMAVTNRGVGLASETRTKAQSEQAKRVPKRSNELTAPAMVSSPLELAPSQPSPCKADNSVTTLGELNRGLETTRREVAEQAVTSALTSHVNMAVNEAVEATEIANQESILKIANSGRGCDTILVPARVGFLSRFNKELAEAGEYLFARAAAFVTRAQNIPQSLSVENGAAAIQTAPAEVKAFSKKVVSGHVSVRAGRDARYWIKIDTRKMLEPAVTGWFRASGGSTSDIALVLAAEQEVENLIHGLEARVLIAIDGIRSGDFHLSIAQSGTYVLALSNHFSIFMPRTFVANIDLRYSTP